MANGGRVEGLTVCAWCRSALTGSARACSARCRARVCRGRRRLLAWVASGGRGGVAVVASLPPSLLAAWGSNWDRRSRLLRSSPIGAALGRVVGLLGVEGVAVGAAGRDWLAAISVLQLAPTVERGEWVEALSRAVYV